MAEDGPVATAVAEDGPVATLFAISQPLAAVPSEAHTPSHPSVGSWLVSNLFATHFTAVHPLDWILVQDVQVPPGTVAHSVVQQSEAVHVPVAQVFDSTSFK